MATPKQFPLSVVIQGVDRISEPLRRINRTLNDTFKPARMLGQSLKNLSNESGLNRLGRGLSDAHGHIVAAGNAMGTFRNRILMATSAAAGLGYIFTREFIGTAATMERLKMSLNAIEGSAKAGGEAFAYIKKTAVETPFETEDIAKAYRIMRGFGVDPTNGNLQAIIDQVAKLGGQGDDLSGIALQLGQAWSKARLQAQDANIMIERGVPVWGLLQRAALRYGKDIPIKQLREMSEKGQLGQKAIAMLMEQMGLEAKGASDMMMTTWSGMMGRIQDSWMFFKLKIMESGPFEWLKSKLIDFLDTVNKMEADGSLDKLAEQIGGRVVEGLKALWKFGNDAIVVLKAMWAPVQALYNIFGSWKPILFAVGAYIGASLVVAVVQLTAAMWALTAAFVANPIGLFTLAVVGIALAIYGAGKAVAWLVLKVMDNWDKIKEATVNLGKFIGDVLKAAFNFTPLGMLFKGISMVNRLRGDGAAGAMAGGAPVATGAPAALAGGGLLQSTQTNNASVQVDFSNMPKGVNVVPGANNTAGLGLNLGYAMAN